MARVDDAYFRRLSGDAAESTYRSDPSTGGPWAAHLQHGGPPNALMVAAAEACASAETGRADLVALRLATEFVGPVPVTDVTVRAHVVRAARAGALVDTRLAADGRDCLHGRVWLVREADTTAVAAGGDPAEVPSDQLPGLGASFPYADSIDWRLIRGGLREPGPGVAWARPRHPVLADVPLTSLQLAALVGDSASGLSSELDWRTWSFLNIDLDVHLARHVEGDWLLLDAATHLGPRGAALARGTLSDASGVVGTTAQTLVLEPIHR